jgi:hypothetical protein
LSFSDPSNNLPSVLASLPGKLQSTINTMLVLSSEGSGGDQAAASGPAGGSAGAQAAMAGAFGRGGRMNAPGATQRRAMGGPPAALLGQGGPPAAFGPRGGNGGAGSENGSDGALVLSVEADKLPKADELKQHLFPGTLAINVSDQDVRLTWRTAFPDLGLLIDLAPLAASLPAAHDLHERLEKLQSSAASSDASASGGGTSSGQPTQGPAAAAPAASAPSAPQGAPQGGGRGRRGRPQ